MYIIEMDESTNSKWENVSFRSQENVFFYFVEGEKKDKLK